MDSMCMMSSIPFCVEIPNNFTKKTKQQAKYGADILHERLAICPRSWGLFDDDVDRWPQSMH